jgi:RHS repeat-associated protein
VTDDGTNNEPDGVVDANDPDYYFVYDTRWRIVATYRETDANPKEQFVYHSSGLGGSGSGSYIDAVVLRDRDDTNGWAGAADGTLEERVYSCQNWRADVSAIVSDAGEMVESCKYSSYGLPFGIPAGDSDGDGDADNDDRNRIISWSSAGYGLRGDLNLDGIVNGDDQTLFDNGPSGETLGRGALSRSDVLSRKGYAGYENDGSLQELYHVRYRVLHSGLGRWTRRDPAGYVDGSSLFEYVASLPTVNRDSLGLITWTSSKCKKKFPSRRACKACCRNHIPNSLKKRSNCYAKCDSLAPPPPPVHIIGEWMPDCGKPCMKVPPTPGHGDMGESVCHLCCENYCAGDEFGKDWCKEWCSANASPI